MKLGGRQGEDRRELRAVGVAEELWKESAKQNLKAEKFSITEREMDIFAIWLY